MPQRPRQHVLETESRVEFERTISPRFLFRPDVPDYAVDGDVEEFDEGTATGRRFYVQLKATDEEDLGEALKVALTLEKASYYRALPLPLLMVLYHAPTAAFYVRWFHQFDPYYGGLGEKYLTFRWQLEDAYDQGTPDRVVADTRAFHHFRSSDLDLPLRVYVDRPAEGVFGISEAELGLALRRAGARRPDIVEVVLGDPQPGSVLLRFGSDEIKANLGNVATATMHVEEYDPEGSGDQVAMDAMILLALAFEHIGQPDIAGRLAATFLPDSAMVVHPDVSGALSYSMARARRILEALDLADRLDQSENPACRDASPPFTLPALYHGASLSREELARFREVLQARIDRRIAEGNEVEAGRAAFNLANTYRTNAEPQDAARLYELATEYDPEYTDRAHYWEEYGGALFGSHRYDESADAYARAVGLGGKPELNRLQADAMLFAGRYRRALDGFQAYNRDYHGDEDAEWRLKEFLLERIVDDLGIAEQTRDLARAHFLAGAVADASDDEDEESRQMLRDALGHDALCPLAWFNLEHVDRDDQRQALTDYLAAAVFSEWDVEAFGNAFLLTLALEEGALGSDILLTARKFVGVDNLMENFIRYASTREPEFPADEFLRAMEETLEQLPPPPEPSITLRSLEDGAAVETFQVPAHGRRGV